MAPGSRDSTDTPVPLQGQTAHSRTGPVCHPSAHRCCHPTGPRLGKSYCPSMSQPAVFAHINASKSGFMFLFFPSSGSAVLQKNPEPVPELTGKTQLYLQEQPGQRDCQDCHLQHLQGHRPAVTGEALTQPLSQQKEHFPAQGQVRHSHSHCCAAL